MENIFVVAGFISIIFLVMKFVEMRFLDKESKPLKVLIRDALLVYFSVISGYFIMEQLSDGMKKMDGGKATPVFVDNPEF